VDEPDRMSTLQVIGAVIGTIVVVALLGAVVALIRDRSVSLSMAYAFYFVGCIVFLVGTLPTGGISLFRGPTRRRPTGGNPYALSSVLLGALLLGIGVALDVTKPF
jgi:Na+/melibiose symporter-like transporter